MLVILHWVIIGKKTVIESIGVLQFNNILFQASDSQGICFVHGKL